MKLLRLDKYLADMQTGTRSQVKEYIRKGRIKVNGVVCKSPNTKIDTQNDTVAFDDCSVSYVKTEYYMLNKPAGVLSATIDKKASTVLDLIDLKRKDLFPVGRLDKDTEGLLIITNDGDMAHNLLSPKKHVDKLYFAKVEGIINDKHVKMFKDGVVCDKEFKAMPAKLEVIENVQGTYEQQSYSLVYVTVKEGKFHQIKRMFEAVGSKVLYLKRLAMGSLYLDKELPVGKYRALTDDELALLKADSINEQQSCSEIED